MPIPRQQKIEQLKTLFEEVLKDDTPLVEEVKAILGIVNSFLVETKKAFDAELLGMRETVASETSSSKKELNTGLAQVRSLSDAMLSKVEGKLATLKDGYTPQKGVDYVDGEKGQDADPKEVAKLVLTEILPKVPTKKEFDDLKTELEKIEKLEKLEADIEILKARPVQTQNGGGANARNFIKEFDLSSKLDGATKSFNVGAFYRVLTIDLSSFPNALRKGIDYTYAGNDGTITFSSEIDAATSLAAGQTCIITLILT